MMRSPSIIALSLVTAMIACERSAQQRHADSTAPRVDAFVQCVVSTQLSGDPRGPVTYEEWDQACKNPPTTGELSPYLAAHSDLPSGVTRSGT